MYNEYEDENELSNWTLKESEFKSIKGFAGLAEEEFSEVLKFLVELAKLEIKLQEV